ncbi:MAG: T9SS type A sorting domain-containing protein [Saprospiraceae bacterium]|nr:T9SS type A sorting domain-containing protein [Saprospiraceae bacterium]
MIISPGRLPLLLVFCMLWSLTYSQDLREYKYLKVLSGQVVDVPVESNIYPDFIRRPARGSVSKFKFGYEDVYRVRYTSASNYSGLDTVIYKTRRVVNGIQKAFFEGFVVETSKVIAEQDFYALDLRDGSVSLDVVSNDRSISGSLLLSKFTYVSNGLAAISNDKGSIRFTPTSTGYSRIGYSVCGNGQCAAGSVLVRIDDRSVNPMNDSSRYRILRDESVTILVSPGFVAPSSTYYSGSLTKIGPQVYVYEAPLGYSGTEVLKFSRLFGGAQIQHIVTIEVNDPYIHNGWNLDDHFYTEVGSSITFGVLQNDLGGTIGNIFTSGLKGTLTGAGPGTFIYTPTPGFIGQTKFNYEVCGENRCDIAEVSVIVHNYEPQYENIKLYTGKNLPISISYDIPIDDFAFEATRQSNHGQIEISADRKSFTYTPQEGFIGPDFFVLNYCAGSQGFCQSINVEMVVQDVIAAPCDDCVWQGDHNNDGQVDVQDAVVLATNLGYSGPTRSGNNSFFWIGQNAIDWPESIVYGTKNLKYVDSNGDGLTSTADLQAVGNFYMKAHGIMPSPPMAMDPVPLRLNLLTPEVEAGEWAIIEVSLGSSSIPVHDMLGVNFSFEVGSRFVDSSSISFTIAKDGIFNPINSVIAFVKSPQDGRIDVGIGKVDREPITGHGVLGQIRFIVEEDLNGFRSLKDLLKVNIEVDRIVLLSEGEDVASLEATFTSLRLKRPSTQESISLFPNPAQSWLQVNGEVRSVNIFDLSGQKVVDIPNRQSQVPMQIDLRALSSGLYLVQILSGNGEVITKKLEIIR